MKHYRFAIFISAYEFEQVYQGAARNIVVTAHNGLRVQIPALRFLPFVSKEGVRGQFELCVDQQNKFVSLQRLA